MVYTCLPAVYYHLNLDATKRVCWQAGFSAVPAVFFFVFNRKIRIADHYLRPLSESYINI